MWRASSAFGLRLIDSFNEYGKGRPARKVKSEEREEWWFGREGGRERQQKEGKARKKQSWFERASFPEGLGLVYGFRERR